MTIRTRGALFAGTALSLFALAACGGTTSSTPAGTASSPSTVATGSTAAGPGGMPMQSAPAGPHNQADITFASMMIVHHKGAIQMADLAPTRAASSQVKDLAVKIKAAQAPEITEMSGWLTAWAPGTGMNGMPMDSAPSPQMSGMSGMGNGSNSAGTTAMPSVSTMPGMMSDQQMSQLTAASGATFDKQFLQLMITHHQGALTMAETEKKQGSNPEALKLAASITSSQTAEIAAMQKLLTTL
ncbi:MAG: DUF305 domain-containing protein [Nakamurella sp.]